MRENGIINAKLVYLLTALKHTDCCIVADAGLPIPKDVECIDLTLIKGIPSFKQVLKAVMKEITLESYIMAKETKVENQDTYQTIQDSLSDYPCKEVSHEELKRLSQDAKFIIRTGEVTPYSNIILISSPGF